MRTLIALLIYAAATVLSVNSAVVAAALFLWNDIFRPLEFARATGLFPAAYYVLAVLIGAFFLNFARGRIRWKWGLYPVAFVGLLAWLLITVAMSPFRAVAWEQCFTNFKYLLPLLLIFYCIQTRRDIRLLAGVLCCSVGLWSAQAGAYCLLHGVNTEIGIPDGQMTDRNDFAAAIVGTVPILIYFALSYNWKFKIPVRIGFAFAAFLSVCAVVFSLSRGGSLGLGASAFLFCVYVSKKKIRDTAILAAVVGVTLLVLPQSWWDRMATIELSGEQTEGSANERVRLMIGAWKCTVDHPIFGVGPGGWLEVAMEYAGDDHNPHSIYMVLSSETGFVGLGLFLALMGITAVRVNKTIKDALRRKDTETARLGSCILVCLFGLLTSMTFLNRPFNEYLWAWVTLANALPGIYQRELAARAKKLKNAAKKAEAAKSAAREAEREGTRSEGEGRAPEEAEPESPPMTSA